MLNFAAKVYNETPKPKSKTQQMKAEKAKSQKIVYVECDKCHVHDTTLFKSDGKYFCKAHRPKN